MLLLPPPKQTENGNPFLEFLPDSPEQIAESMERLGPLRDQLLGAFQEAIDRVNKGRQGTEQPAIDETRER